MQARYSHSSFITRTLAALAILAAFSTAAWADTGDEPLTPLLDIAKAWEDATTSTGRMGIDDELNSYGILVFRTNGKRLLASVPAYRVSARNLSKLPVLVPAQLFGLNMQCSPVQDAQLKHVARFKTLTALKLYATPVTDIGLKELVDLQYLTMLDLGRTKVTDAGLKELARVKNLTLLGLQNTRVTDAGMKELAKLKNLTTLDLRYTKVTATGLRELADLKNLTKIYLTPHKLTEIAFKE